MGEYQRSTGRNGRDQQRQRVYSSERLVIPGRRFNTIEECQVFITSILWKRWFTERWGKIGVTAVRVRKSNAARGGIRTLELPIWAWNERTILHELAHCCTDRVDDSLPWHGPEFVRVFHFLVQNVMGVEVAKELSNAFYDANVDMAPKTWLPEPAAHRVVTKKAVVEKLRAAERRPVTPREAREAAETLRRAARTGVFGASGRKPRAHALEAARLLDGVR